MTFLKVCTMEAFNIDMIWFVNRMGSRQPDIRRGFLVIIFCRQYLKCSFQSFGITRAQVKT